MFTMQGLIKKIVQVIVALSFLSMLVKLIYASQEADKKTKPRNLGS